jgi:ketosteroid isomerase-like protein
VRSKAPLVLVPIVAGPAYRAAVRFLIRYLVRRLSAGEVEPLLRMYADDATLVFPGRHSWGRDYHGKAEVEGFLRRFVSAGLRGETQEVLVNGPPWNTSVAVLFNDQAPGDYENRAVIFVKIRWGKIYFEETYEDTQKVAEWEERVGPRGDLPVPGP